MLKTIKKKPKASDPAEPVDPNITETPADTADSDTGITDDDDIGPDDTDVTDGDEPEDEIDDVEIETERLLGLNDDIAAKESFLSIVEKEGVSPSTVMMARSLGLMCGTSLGDASLEAFKSPEEMEAGVAAVRESLVLAEEGFLDGLKNLVVGAAKKVMGLFKGIFGGMRAAAAGGWHMIKNHPIATLLGLVTCMTGGLAIARVAAGTAISKLTTEQAAMGFFGRICAMFKNIKFPDGTQIFAQMGQFGQRMKISFKTVGRVSEKNGVIKGLAAGARSAGRSVASGVSGVADAALHSQASPMQAVNGFKAVLKAAWEFITDLPMFIAKLFGDGAKNALVNHQSGLGRKIYEAGGKKIMSATTSTKVVNFVEGNIAFILFTSLVKIVWRCAKKFLSFFSKGDSGTPAPGSAPAGGV